MAQIAVALLLKHLFLKPQQHSQNQPKSKFLFFFKFSLGYCILNVNYCDLSGNLEFGLLFVQISGYLSAEFTVLVLRLSIVSILKPKT